MLADLTRGEIDCFIKNYKVSRLESIGSDEWFVKNNYIVKLYQMSSREQRNDEERRINDAVCRQGKLKYLVKDLIILSVWKEKVFSELVRMDLEPQNELPSIMLIYSELQLVGLLLNLLADARVITKMTNNCCEDIIDYCMYKLKTVNLKDIPDPPSVNEKLSPNMNIEKHNKRVTFISITFCCTILRLICEWLENLSESVANRIYLLHDIPAFITHLLDKEIWCKKENNKMYKFSECKWYNWSLQNNSLCELEIETWMLLRQLLINPICAKIFDISKYKDKYFTILKNLLTQQVIHQVEILDDIMKCLNNEENETKTISKFEINNVNETKRFRNKVYNVYKNRWEILALDASVKLFFRNNAELAIVVDTFSDCMSHVLKNYDEEIQQNSEEPLVKKRV